MNLPRSLRYGLVMATISLPLAACSHHVEETDSTGAVAVVESSFVEQAAAVRRGESVEIRLDDQEVADSDLAHLVGLENKLVRLNLSHTSITDAGLAQIAFLPSLELLRINAPEITDAGVAVLARLPQLKHLHLIDVPLGDQGLAQLESLKSLSSLYLDGTQATDTGMRSLVEALPGVHLHFDGGHHRLDARPEHPH